MDYTAVTTHYLDEDVAAKYDAERFSDPMGRLFDVLERRALRSMMRRAVAGLSAPRILDVPCGTGRITRVWLEMGLPVKGGDISPAMIKVAERRCAAFREQVSFETIDLDQPLPGAGDYDVITCIRLLHHLDSADRVRVLRRIAEARPKYVIANLPYSSAYYRGRRAVKRMLRQGVSRTSATWQEICEETAGAGLRVAGQRFMAPLVSENLILLLAPISS